MYRDCDHLVSENKVYTIRGNWRTNEVCLLAKPVYERENTTGTFKKIVDLKGIEGENLIWLDPRSFKHISCKGIDLNNYTGDSVWDRIVRALVDLGIPAEEIGLFGSKKLGFPNCKDEDFIIYGVENMRRLKSSIDWFKKRVGLYNHTLNHAMYQVESHGKYFDTAQNNLLLCLLNKWSTCSFTEEKTTTIRFVDDSVYTGDILKEYVYNKSFKESTMLKGVVSNADGTSYMPRTFTLETDSGNIDVIVPLWIFHQCVKDNDLVEVTGTIINGKLVVRGYHHGIKFI